MVLTTPHCPHITRPPGALAPSGTLPRNGQGQVCQPPEFPWPHGDDSGKVWPEDQGPGEQERQGQTQGLSSPPARPQPGLGRCGDAEGPAHGSAAASAPFCSRPAGVRSGAPSPESWNLSGMAQSYAPCWQQGPTLPDTWPDTPRPISREAPASSPEWTMGPSSGLPALGQLPASIPSCLVPSGRIPGRRPTSSRGLHFRQGSRDPPSCLPSWQSLVIGLWMLQPHQYLCPHAVFPPLYSVSKFPSSKDTLYHIRAHPNDFILP